MILAYFWKKNSPHNLLYGLCDLGYFWGKKNPHNLFSNLCDVIYFWKKILPTTSYLVFVMISSSKAISSSSKL
jgi:hypothetical protein